MAEQTKLLTVREQIDQVKDKLVDEGKIAPDATAAANAAAVPAFSEGTQPIDGRTGKPVVAKPETPTFTDGGVAIEQGGDKLPDAPPSPTDKAAILQAHKQRLADAEAGKLEPAAGAQAAEAAAEQIADAFADYDEFEFEDPDLELKFPIRVPKQYSETAKRGYGRRAAQDRLIRYLKDSEPVLRPMIEDGRIKQILPLIQAALENPQYGEYVTGGFQRLQKGLPLIEQAKIEAAQAAVEPPQSYDFSGADPFFAEQLAPFQKTIETLQQRLDRQDQERQQTAAQQQQAAERSQRMALEMQAAHKDLAAAYPEQCRLDLGPNDPFWQKACKLARESGYVENYGIRAGVVFGAQMAHQIEQERLAATASPAAAALTQMENKNMDLARQQAANGARTVGAGSATQAPPPAPVARPTSFNPDGTLKSAPQILVENQAWLASQGATA